MGKGSKPRPRRISYDQWLKNCEAAGIMGEYGIKTPGADVNPRLVYESGYNPPKDPEAKHD
jgi:hypothetical protein